MQAKEERNEETKKPGGRRSEDEKCSGGRGTERTGRGAPKRHRVLFGPEREGTGKTKKEWDGKVSREVEKGGQCFVLPRSDQGKKGKKEAGVGS